MLKILTVYTMPMGNAENHWNALKLCLFCQTTKQTSGNFEPWKF